MKLKHVIGAVGLDAFIIAGILLYIHRPVAEVIRLELTGTTGLPVSGSYITDGETHAIAGVLPITVEAKARDFQYEVKIAAGEGDLRGKLSIEGGTFGSSGAQGSQRGVRGHFHRSWFGESAGFTTLSKED